MSVNFPSKEQISSMSIDGIKSLVPMDQEDEALMDSELKKRVVNKSVDDKIYRDDALNAEINTPEEEAKWQKILDDRREEILKRELGEEAYIARRVEKLEKEAAIIGEEIASAVEVSLSVAESEIEKSKEDAENPKEEVDTSVKCVLCGSKGVRHKNGCPTLVK